jgi:predicted ATPase
MLKSVHITRFRSCENVTLDISSPITALVGRNGAGKTNVLAAIEWLALAATSADVSSAEQRFSFHPTPQRAVMVDLILDKHYRYALDQRAKFEGGGTYLVTLAERLSSFDSAGKEVEIFRRREESLQIKGREAAIKIGRTHASLPALSSLLPEGEELATTAALIVAFLMGVRYYPLTESMQDAEREMPVVPHAEYKRWLASPEVGGNASVMMRLIQLYLKERPKFDELNSLLGPKGLHVLEQMDVSTIKVGAEPKRRFYVVELTPAGAKEDRGSYAFHELSTGTRRIVRLMLCLICDSSAVMLVEQPEDGLHPGLTTKLLGMLEAYSIERQVILSTHSPAMLNTLEPQALRIVELKNGITHVRAMDAEELQAAKKFLEDDGSLYEFLESVDEA